jgi:hypothetical protein
MATLAQRSITSRMAIRLLRQVKGRARSMRQVSPISEEPVLAHLERRLVHEFPRVSPEHVDAVVRREHARFDASPIRGFIPLFIEKHVRDELGHST